MYWNSNQEEDEQVLVQHNVDMIQQMIEAHPQITALFAMQYELALFAKEAIEHMGLHIPQDISIICFDSPQASAA